MSVRKKMLQDVFNVMEALGGKYRKEHEDDYWSFSRQPLVISFADPRIIELPASVDVALSVSICELLFSKLVEEIKGTKAWPLLVSTLRIEVTEIDNFALKLKKAVVDQLAKAEDIDIRQEVERLASDRPDFPVMKQVSHLAALAWKGDFITLGEYEAVFERGKHLNFLPMITKDMIARALELSYDQVR